MNMFISRYLVKGLLENGLPESTAKWLCICVCIYIYIYIYSERERCIYSHNMNIYACIHVFVYVYIYIYILMYNKSHVSRRGDCQTWQGSSGEKLTDVVFARRGKMAK